MSKMPNQRILGQMVLVRPKRSGSGEELYRDILALKSISFEIHGFNTRMKFARTIVRPSLFYILSNSTFYVPHFEVVKANGHIAF